MKRFNISYGYLKYETQGNNLMTFRIQDLYVEGVLNMINGDIYFLKLFTSNGGSRKQAFYFNILNTNKLDSIALQVYEILERDVMNFKKIKEVIL